MAVPRHVSIIRWSIQLKCCKIVVLGSKIASLASPIFAVQKYVCISLIWRSIDVEDLIHKQTIIPGYLVLLKIPGLSVDPKLATFVFQIFYDFFVFSEESKFQVIFIAFVGGHDDEAEKNIWTDFQKIDFWFLTSIL